MILILSLLKFLYAGFKRRYGVGFRHALIENIKYLADG